MNGDCVKCNVTAGGTGALTLGSPVAGFRTPAAAGLGATGYVNYRIEWAAGWAIGLGTLSADALTLTRVHEYASDANNTIGSAAPYRDVPSSGAVMMVVPDARSCGQSTALSLLINGVNSDYCFCIGGGAIATGSPNSLVIGEGQVDINSPGALVLGAGTADQPGMLAEQNGSGTQAMRFKLVTTTTNATPIDLFADGASIRPRVPAQTVWLIRCFIVALVSNSPGAIGNVYSRELRAVGKPTGQVGSTVSTAISSDAGFSGSATITIDGSGNVKVTVTGMAATTINWSAHLEITPAYAS